MRSNKMINNRKKVPLKKNLKRLILSFKKYFLPILISLIAIIGSVVLSVYAPQILKKLTDTIANGQIGQNIDMSLIAKYGIILIIMYVSNALLTYFSSFMMNYVTQCYTKGLRNEISLKINKMKLKYFDSHQYGDTLSIVTNDVDTISQSMQQSITMLFQSILMLGGTLIGMFVTSYQMAFTILATLPLVFIMIVVIMKFALPLFKKRQDVIGEVNAIVEENYSGFMITKAFSKEKEKSKVFNSKNEELHQTMFKAQFFGGIMQPMMSFISYFAYALVFIVGGILMVNNLGVTFGTITAFMIYANLFQSPLSQIAQAMNTLQMAGAASERVFEFLDEEELDDEKNSNKVIDLNNVKGNVEFRNVKFGYDQDKIIIHSFSCKINQGSKVAIVGPTGAGKTTIVNLLMRFYEMNDGDIILDGVSIKDIKRKNLRDLFGMVLQDTWMFEGTLKENIIYNKKDVSDEELKEVIEEANLKHYVETLPNGVDTYLHEESSFSSGQKQLITIARAMIENAPLLILDEATSNVDTRTEIQIQNAMDKLTKGRTSFVIAHRLSTIKNADIILVMKDGNIIEHGNHEELMKQNGFYASLYNSQFENSIEE